jgi:hypothetical protein
MLDSPENIAIYYVMQRKMRVVQGLTKYYWFVERHTMEPFSAAITVDGWSISMHGF